MRSADDVRAEGYDAGARLLKRGSPSPAVNIVSGARRNGPPRSIAGASAWGVDGFVFDFRKKSKKRGVGDLGGFAGAGAMRDEMTGLLCAGGRE
jgi:hypothetical protein